MEGVLCDTILAEFDAHSARLKARSRARREAVQMRNIATDTAVVEAADASSMFGKWQPGDVYQGDVNIRTLRALLVKIDEAGFERSGAPPAPFTVRATRHRLTACRALQRTRCASTRHLSGRWRASCTRPTGAWRAPSS